MLFTYPGVLARWNKMRLIQRVYLQLGFAASPVSPGFQVTSLGILGPFGMLLDTYCTHSVTSRRESPVC